MKITIVYDNEATDDRLEPGWGFSSVIDIDGKRILFDTGWDSKILFDNMGKLKIKPESVEKVVISHEHWDHMGGLTDMIRRNPDFTLYVPRSFGRKLKEELAGRVELVEVSEPEEVTPSCISTGELGSGIKEQSLVLRSPNGNILLTGCAHPGMLRIMARAKEFGDIKTVCGGMHRFKEYGLLEGIPNIMPCHCTFYKANIARIYPEAYTPCGAGTVLEL